MYLRFSQRANADGTLVRYVALAHNRRVDGKAKPDVLMNLGRVDRLDVDGLLRLAALIRKHFADGGGLTDSAEAGLAAGAAPMAVADARPIGTAWLLDALWTGWRSAPRSSGSPMAGGSPRRSSGCCSRWSVTGRSRR
jgi:hypothetical protein